MRYGKQFNLKMYQKKVYLKTDCIRNLDFSEIIFNSMLPTFLSGALSASETRKVIYDTQINVDGFSFENTILAIAKDDNK